jgi:hypothetical protein
MNAIVTVNFILGLQFLFVIFFIFSLEFLLQYLKNIFFIWQMIVA